MNDQTDTTRVTDHYAPGDLRAVFLDVLRSWGKEDAPLTPDDLAPIDQFHVGGQGATLTLAELAGIDATTRVLDLGGGFGGPARTIAAASGCTVTVVDLTEAYCQVGELLTARCGLGDRVTFRHANALAVPFADGAFDLAWTQHSSMNIADKRGLYTEIARLLCPGGRLALYEIMAGPHGAPHFPVPWARDPAISFLQPPAAIRALLAELGFREERWEELPPPRPAAPAPGAAPATPPPALHLVLGDDFLERARNLGRNLAEGRVAIVRAILIRP